MVIPDRLSVGMIVPYWPSQMSASDSVNMRPQNRFVDRPTPSEKSIAMVDVKNREISKQISIRTIVELKCEAIWLIEITNINTKKERKKRKTLIFLEFFFFF